MFRGVTSRWHTRSENRSSTGTSCTRSSPAYRQASARSCLAPAGAARGRCCSRSSSSGAPGTCVMARRTRQRPGPARSTPDSTSSGTRPAAAAPPRHSRIDPSASARASSASDLHRISLMANLRKLSSSAAQTVPKLPWPSGPTTRNRRPPIRTLAPGPSATSGDTLVCGTAPEPQPYAAGTPTLSQQSCGGAAATAMQGCTGQHGTLAPPP
mmetsp:Transcript_72419/g.204721  ORF Transcript_72419/g.204721 Transcript_72419/m.204721 type:complete len:212 (+) Transcript_72419:1524-2159(+)